MMESAVNKLLHAPTTRLKAAAATEDAGEYVHTLQQLFDLPAVTSPERDAEAPSAAADEDDERLTH